MHGGCTHSRNLKLSAGNRYTTWKIMAPHFLTRASRRRTFGEALGAGECHVIKDGHFLPGVPKISLPVQFWHVRNTLSDSWWAVPAKRLSETGLQHVQSRWVRTIALASIWDIAEGQEDFGGWAHAGSRRFNPFGHFATSFNSHFGCFEPKIWVIMSSKHRASLITGVLWHLHAHARRFRLGLVRAWHAQPWLMIWSRTDDMILDIGSKKYQKAFTAWNL